MMNLPEVKMGIVAVSRDCFPMSLSESRRKAVVAAYKGDFSIELAKGDYLVISTKPFTSAKTETILDCSGFVY